MYHNDEEIPWADIGKVFAFLVMFVGACWFLTYPRMGNAETAPVSSGETALGQQLIFPRGWHLVAAEAYTFQATGPYVVYICQKDTNSSMYRICTPKTVEESNATDIP